MLQKKKSKFKKLQNGKKKNFCPFQVHRCGNFSSGFRVLFGGAVHVAAAVQSMLHDYPAHPEAFHNQYTLQYSGALQLYVPNSPYTHMPTIY